MTVRVLGQNEKNNNSQYLDLFQTCFYALVHWQRKKNTIRLQGRPLQVFQEVKFICYREMLSAECP